MTEIRLNHPENREAPPAEVRTMFRDADEAAILDIERRYQDLLPPERLEEMRAHQTSFESGEEFRADFARRFGQAPEAGTLGWSLGPTEAAHVSTSEPGAVPEVTYHERLHQAADAETAHAVAEAWHEGMTQAFTERATGQTHEGEERAPYPEETARARGVAETTGWEAAERLYFGGDREAMTAEVAGTEDRPKKDHA